MMTVVAVGGLAVATPHATAEPTIYEYPPTVPLATPCEIEFDATGTAWVEEIAGNAITRLDPATGAMTRFPLTNPAGIPSGMEFGPDGHLWFSEVAGNAIVRLDPADGSMESFPMPYTGTLLDNLPLGIRATIDVSGNKDRGMWFTMAGLNAIGRIDIDTKQFTSYPLPTPGAVPLIIQPGPGNTMVFSELLGNKIATIDVTTKEIREYPVHTPASLVQGVTTAADGTVWWTGTGGQQLGTLNVTTGAVREIPIIPLRTTGPLPISIGNPLPMPGPVRIGSDGTIYFAEGNLVFAGNKVGQYNPRTNTLREFPTPTPLSAPCDLNNQHPGKIYFGEFTGNRVGRLTYG
jgi:virginiamycin B lyase